MHAMLAMIRANLKMTVRNRSALFWNLLFPALFIVIFGALLNNTDSITIDVGITGDSSSYEQAVTSTMQSNDTFKVTTDADKDQQAQLNELKDGNLDAVLVFGASADGGMPPVTVYYDDSNGPTANVTLSVVNQTLMSVAQAENPIAIVEQPVSGQNVSYINFLVPGIIAMSLMNSGVIGLSTAFVTYRERGILRRIRMTPFPLPNFILARVSSQVVVAFSQAAILLLLGSLLYGVTVEGNIALVALVVLIGALTFLAIGFLISSFARTTEEAAGLSNLITFPMLFLSGVFFNTDNAPAWLKPITKLMPLHYLVEALRQPMTFGKGLSAIWTDLLELIATFVIAVLLAVRFFKWDSRAV
jgi:ABC-2 type transport system permease protein